MTALDQKKSKGLGASVPPLEEQQPIVFALNRKTSKVDLQKRKIGLVIEWLNEYRSALVTYAVTRKIDVRNFEIPLPAREFAHA